MADRTGAGLAYQHAQLERRAVEAGGKFSILGSMTNPKVLLLSVNYLGIVTASLGLLLFIPQIIKSSWRLDHEHRLCHEPGLYLRGDSR